MKGLFGIAVLTLAVSAVPLPDGPPGVRKWIKVNEREYEVPAHLTPNQYYEQLFGPRPSVPIPRAQVPIPRAQTPVMPRPQPFVPQPIIPRAQSSTVSQYQMPAGGSFHVGFVPYSEYRSAPTTSVRVPPPPPPRPMPAPMPAFMPARQPYFTVQRQWVKLREGTMPFEVPAGMDPQQYVQQLRLSGAPAIPDAQHRFLRKKKFVIPYKAPPVKKAAPPPVKKAPPPPPVKKAPVKATFVRFVRQPAKFVPPQPAKFVPPQPTKFVPPPPVKAPLPVKKTPTVPLAFSILKKKHRKGTPFWGKGTYNGKY